MHYYLVYHFIFRNVFEHLLAKQMGVVVVDDCVSDLRYHKTPGSLL